MRGRVGFLGDKLLTRLPFNAGFFPNRYRHKGQTLFFDTPANSPSPCRPPACKSPGRSPCISDVWAGEPTSPPDDQPDTPPGDKATEDNLQPDTASPPAPAHSSSPNTSGAPPARASNTWSPDRSSQKNPGARGHNPTAPLRPFFTAPKLQAKGAGRTATLSGRA